MRCRFFVGGAGMAGICAAVQAGRLGLSTVLVEKEMMLGGNAGPNLGVVATGPIVENPYALEMGVVQEIAERIAQRNAYLQPYQLTFNTCPLWDQVVTEMLEAAHVTVLRHHLILDTTVTEGRITAVRLVNIDNSDEFTVVVEGFVLDATGNAVLAAKSGAEWRMGREGVSETGERCAPPQPDDTISAASVSALVVDAGVPSPFTTPPGTPKWNPGKSYTTFDPKRRMSHLYRIDDGGTAALHSLYTPQELYRKLMYRVYSQWDFLKNVRYAKEAVNHQLVWISPILGHRESRRIVGDYMLTQTDIEECRVFADAVGFGGHPLDEHLPSPDGGYNVIYHSRPLPFDIPFRCIYSRNISNLFAGGRAISVTHLAFTSTRTIRTGGCLGQAAAVAAKLCLDKGLTPAQLVADPAQVQELQQALLREDGFILGVPGSDEADLARRAVVTASSEAVVSHVEQRVKKKIWQPADGFGVLLRLIPHTVQKAAFYLRNNGAESAEVKLSCAYGEEALKLLPFTPPPPDNNMCDYSVRPKTIAHWNTLGEAVTTVLPGFKGWVEFILPAGIEVPPMQRHLVHQAVRLMLTGAVEVATVVNDLEFVEPCGSGSYKSLPPRLPAFRITPDPLVGNTQWILDGYRNREGVAKPHQWISAGGALPQWIELAWEQPQSIRTMELVFDTTYVADGLALRRANRQVHERCVAAYRVLAEKQDDEWETLISETGNFRRFRRHVLSQAVKTQKLRLVADAMGEPGERVRVYEIRVYA